MNYKVYISTALSIAICTSLVFTNCNRQVKQKANVDTTQNQIDKKNSEKGESIGNSMPQAHTGSAQPGSQVLQHQAPETRNFNFCDIEVTEEAIQNPAAVDDQSTLLIGGVPASLGNISSGFVNVNQQSQVMNLQVSPSTAVMSPGQKNSNNKRLEKDVAFSGSILPEQTLAGKLTAGEIHDFSKWKLWEDIAKNDLNIYQAQWRMYPQERYCTTVQTKEGEAVVDCPVDLLDESGAVLWSAHTDNTGKAELWGSFYSEEMSSKPSKIRVTYRGKSQMLEKIKPISRGVNSVKISTACDAPEALDIMFCVDATGSMGDEIDYLKAELQDIINQTAKKKPELDIRLGSIFYRCVGNSYTTKKSPFSKTVSTTTDFIKQQNAEEGGTEAVEIALHEAVNDFQWSASARARILFMVLDETPGLESEVIQKLHEATTQAAQKGIRIIPLVSSGVNFGLDKSLEYLMRSLALATNGTYAFLTDHSGIGGSHTAPSTDKYKVELLNDLMLRLIDQFTYVPECEEDSQPIDESDTTSVSLHAGIDSLAISGIETLQLNYWPNPARFDVNVQTSVVMDEIVLTDNSGKLLLTIKPIDRKVKFDLTDFPSGIFHIRARKGDKWLKGKLVVSR